MKNLTLKSLLALLISVSVIVGCSDENEVALNKCFVSSFTSEESTVTLSYNSENKPTSMVAAFTVDGVTISITSTISYDSKGNMSKTESPNSYSTFTYNSNNQVSREEYYDDNKLEERIDYEYNSSGQMIKNQSFYTDFSGQLVKSSYHIYTYSSSTTKNPSKEEEFSSSGTFYESNEFTFDDKNTWFSAIGGGVLFGEVAAEENNLTKNVSRDEDGNVSSTTTFVYEYNDKGYPTKVTSTEVNSGGSEVSIQTYTYNCK